ncbi:MAG: CsbD family protein [Leadbetterella sp.]|nr:CsbD family protein [Leadbetterella sp.]
MSTFEDKLKGNWNQAKGILKQKWADLTDDDLLYEEGKEDELVGKIQKRTGETKEQINAFIEGLKFD